MSKNCEAYTRIEAALYSGTLSEEDRAWWTAHRQSCEHCREQWLVHQQLTTALGRSVGPALPVDFSEKFWRNVGPVAAPHCARD